MAKPKDKKPNRDSRDAASLRRRLVARERQLAELTAHSLRILDELTAARSQASSQAATQQRIAALEASLADVRQRLRNGSRAILSTASGAAAELGADVVLWGFAQDPGRQIESSVAGFGGIPTTVMMGQQHRAESFADAAKAGWVVLESSCARPAHYWNQAMAATTQDVVVFVKAGVEVGAAALAKIVEAARCTGVAASCPKVMRGGAAYMGCSEQGILEVHPMPFTADVASALAPYPSAEAFGISRQVFEAVGPFDQDLATETALVEWSMRAVAQSLRVVGVANAEALDEVREPEAQAKLEADRLVVLARHRPHQLISAAMASETLWTADADTLAGTLRAAIQRLPRAHEFPAAVEILAQQAQSVASFKRIAPALRGRIVALCRELQLPVEAAPGESALPSLMERATAQVAALRQQAASAAKSAQEAERAKREQVQAATRHTEIERELKDGMLARSGTIDALRNELLERERAIGSLRQELGHRKGESQRFIDHLAEQQQAIVDLQEQATRDKAELERLAGVEVRCRAAEEQLALFRDSLASTLRSANEADVARTKVAIQESEELRASLKSLESQLAAARRQLDERVAAHDGAAQALSQEIQKLQAAEAAAISRAEAAERAAAHADERADAADAMSKAAGARALGLEARLRAADARIAELESAFEEARTQAAQEQAIEKARAERHLSSAQDFEQRLVQALSLTASLKAEVSKSEVRSAEIERVRARMELELDSVRQELRSTQQDLRDAEVKRREVDARVEVTEQTLREREEWICLLLQEVSQRRLRPRDLLPHEQDFLARHSHLLKP